jgi:hypothetical protein
MEPAMLKTVSMALLPLAMIVAPAGAAVVGKCKFATVALSFAGGPLEQAQCLMRAPKKFGHLDPPPANVPEVVASRIGKDMMIPREKIRAHLQSIGMTEAQLGGSLDSPVSRARNNAPNAPPARYFVIHDTSSPYFRNDPFPPDIDNHRAINRLSGFGGANSAAHMFVNRKGETLVGHDFRTPWRATKLETQVVGRPSKGLFLHIESIQPRRREPTGGPNNDAIAPTPGFSAIQYARLALLYVMASRRAGVWMIPATHAALDEGLSDGHDDPQNFDLAGGFAAALSALVTQLEAN